MESARLHPIDWSGLSRSRALSAYLGKIYFAAYGRNAWHSTWVSRYTAGYSFHATHESARRDVESRRVQGSTWTIRELPALVVAARKGLIAVSEINTATPLKRWPPDFGRSLTLRGLAKRWRPRGSDDLKKFGVTGYVPPPAELPFQTWTSVSHGGQYRLAWRQQTPAGLELSWIQDLIAALNDHLQAAAR